MFAEQLQYRELLWQMTRRDLVLRYKQTIAGAAWAFFVPVLNTAVMVAVFSRMSGSSHEVPFVLYAFVGLLAWNFSAQALKFASTSLSSNAGLVSKVYFPRELFPLSQVIVCAVDTIVASTLLIALLVWYQVTPGVSVLWLPAVALAQLMWTLALALALAMLNLFYRDIKYITDAFLTIGVFTTTALYPPAMLAGRFGQIVVANPFSVVIDGYRAALITGQMDHPVRLVAVLISGLVAFILSWLVFHRAEFRFAETV